MSRVKWEYIIGALLLGTVAVQARDGYEGRPMVCAATDARCSHWLTSAMQPDNREVSCCADADAYITDDFVEIGDRLFAKVTADYPNVPKGTLIYIPRNKINRAAEDGGNPTGHSITFAIGEGSNLIALCYFGPTLS